jgi:hypothetical protein
MRRAVLVTVCGLGLVLPAGSLAAGGPVPSVQGGAGVSVTGSPFNYVALGAGSGTVIERVRRKGGVVDAFTWIPRSFGVASAAYDGSNTGLSADGRTLVLSGIPSQYPPRRTRLLVLDARQLRVENQIALPGFFTVDAISPTGRWLYLIHYRSRITTTDYEVRAYDLSKGQLLAKPIVDPREPDEKMLGIPTTRTMSADGRWAYTLYMRPGASPFIHALDTLTRSAYCVDLPRLPEQDLFAARLVLSPPATLRIENGNKPLALMNTRTLTVRRVGRSPVSSKPHPPRRHDGGPPWMLAIVPLIALIGLVVLTFRRRGRHRLPDRRDVPTADLGPAST